MATHYPDGPYDGDDGATTPPENRGPATITPLYNRAPRTQVQDLMFTDRVFRPQGSRHVYIALHTPLKQDMEDMRPHARTILDRMYKDTGKPRLDLINAVVKSLYRFIPEYAAAAAPVNEHGQPDRMPQVIISLDDGQHIGIGRPGSDGGILSCANDRESALTWAYMPEKPGPDLVEGGNLHAYRYRRLDREYEGQYGAGFDDDARRPVETLLATLLAATEDSRMKIFENVYDCDRGKLPRGPMTVDDPRDCDNLRPRRGKKPAPAARPA